MPSAAPAVSPLAAVVAHHTSAHHPSHGHQHAASHTPLKVHVLSVPAHAAVAPQQTFPFQVWWNYPANGATVTDSPGFIALGISQPLNWNTVNGATVQLAHQQSNGSWQLEPIGVWPNPGDGSVTVVPLTIDPPGRYVVAVYPGLKSVTGDSLSAPFYTFFNVTDPLNPPGGPSNVTAESPADGEQVGLFPGVITADEYKPLVPSSVNSNTVQLYHLNADGSLGAQVSLTDPAGRSGIHYSLQTPTILVAPTEALDAGNYKFIINGVQSLAGGVQQQPFSSTFTVTQNPTLFPDVIPGKPIDVAAIYPPSNLSPSVTSVVTLTFTQNAVASSLNANTIQLVRWLPSQNTWSAPLPVTITYNPQLHAAYLISEQGLPQGYYLVAVNPNPASASIVGQNGLNMAQTEYYHYSLFFQDPPILGSKFGSYPGNGQTISGDPPALEVFFNRYNGQQASSVNGGTVQLHPVINGSLGPALPIAVAYNPWPGAAVINPFEALGDGTYAITVNGIVDILGNVQQGGFQSTFQITGTGRPQTQS